MRLRSVVWHPNERRPRAPVRLLIAAVLTVALLVAWSVLVGPRLAETGSPLSQVVATLVGTGLPGVAVLVAAVVADRRPLSDLGLGIDADWAIDLCFGLLLGAVLVTGVFLAALSAGWVRVVGLFAGGSTFVGFATAFVALAALFVVVGVSEELVARGYVLTNVAEGLSGYLTRGGATAVAVVASSLLFALAHAGNPNATPVSVVGIAFAGVFLASGYVLTGELAIPIGVHVTWNLFLGGVYGFHVSGIEVGVTVVDSAESGPDVVTGGTFGPEAGLLGLTAVVVGTGLTVGYVRYRYGEATVATGLTSPERK